MRIKLVVINEQMLGYISPATPKWASILASSPHALFSPADGPFHLVSSDVTRLASSNDFTAYRVNFMGYNNPNEYEFAT